MLTPFRERFAFWALRRQRHDHGTVTLTQRSIYIIPTRQGLMLAFLLFLMLLGDINYNLSLGYVLTFLLAMMAVMSMLHAFRNLARLEINAGRAEGVFCGEAAQFIFHFRNRGKLTRYQLCLRQSERPTEPDTLSAGVRKRTVIGYLKTFRRSSRPKKVKRPVVCFDVPPQQNSVAALTIKATHRGWLQTGRLTLYTEFPLGLFYAWSYLHFDTRCLVYPRPLEDAPLPLGDSTGGTGKRSISGADDFSGLRRYVAGDPLPRIYWKAYARELGLQVKQFFTPAGEELWLDLANAPDRTEEEKLSRMARWILDAEAQGLRYGLRMPDSELAPGAGPVHRDECLRRLALFNLPQPSDPLPRPLSRKRERGAKETPRPFVGQGLGRGKP